MYPHFITRVLRPLPSWLFSPSKIGIVCWLIYQTIFFIVWLLHWFYNLVLFVLFFWKNQRLGEDVWLVRSSAPLAASKHPCPFHPHPLLSIDPLEAPLPASSPSPPPTHLCSPSITRPNSVSLFKVWVSFMDVINCCLIYSILGVIDILVFICSCVVYLLCIIFPLSCLLSVLSHSSRAHCNCLTCGSDLFSIIQVLLLQRDFVLDLGWVLNLISGPFPASGYNDPHISSHMGRILMTDEHFSTVELHVFLGVDMWSEPDFR